MNVIRVAWLTGAEDLFAVIAARRKIIFVAFGAVEFLITNGKLQLSQRFIALGAVEAGGMPVTIVVLQVLRKLIHVSAQYQPAYNIDVTRAQQ